MGRHQIAIRRSAALVVAAALAVSAWLALAGGGEDGTLSPRPSVAGAKGPDRADRLLAELDTEQRIDQLLLVGFEGAEVDRELARELRSHQLGGVLLDADNWDGADRGEKLIETIRGRAERGVEPLLAVRQEGGEHRQLADLPPSARAIEVGDYADPKLARRWRQDAAKQLRAVGFDLDLGLIGDVATLDTPIADRAFSDDARVTTAMTAAATKGCRKARIACGVGHFPGLGGATQDTEIGPATVALDREGLLGRDVLPFRAAIENGVDAVLVSHASYAAFDPITPASLTPAIVDGLLRDRLGFDGVAIADDLGAGAISATRSPEQAAVEAVAAGIDMLILPGPEDLGPVRAALLEAVDSGAIDAARIDQAAARVLELKRRQGLAG